MPLRLALQIAFYLTSACLCLEKWWWNGCSESMKSSWNPLNLNNIISSRKPFWEFSCLTVLQDWISSKIFLYAGFKAFCFVTNMCCRLLHTLERKWRRTTSQSRQWLGWCGPVWWVQWSGTRRRSWLQNKPSNSWRWHLQYAIALFPFSLTFTMVKKMI